jgi:hypothetical protein
MVPAQKRQASTITGTGSSKLASRTPPHIKNPITQQMQMTAMVKLSIHEHTAWLAPLGSCFRVLLIVSIL